MINKPTSFQIHYAQLQIYKNSGKLAMLHTILRKMKATNHRCLIFSQFKLIMGVLEEYFMIMGYKYLRFDGDVKDEQRNILVNNFNTDDSIFIFLLSTRAASHGLNLQTADTVIIYDCDYNAFYDL